MKSALLYSDHKMYRKLRIGTDIGKLKIFLTDQGRHILLQQLRGRRDWISIADRNPSKPSLLREVGEWLQLLLQQGLATPHRTKRSMGEDIRWQKDNVLRTQVWWSRMGRHYGLPAPPVDLRTWEHPTWGWRTHWRRFPRRARQHNDQDSLVRVPGEEQDPHPVPVHRLDFNIRQARRVPQGCHEGWWRHSPTHCSRGVSSADCSALTWRILCPRARLSPWLQQDLSPDHHQAGRWLSFLLPRDRVQERERHHQRRSPTRRSQRRTNTTNTSVSQSICTMGWTVQEDSSSRGSIGPMVNASGQMVVNGNIPFSEVIAAWYQANNYDWERLLVDSGKFQLVRSCQEPKEIATANTVLRVSKAMLNEIDTEDDIPFYDEFVQDVEKLEKANGVLDPRDELRNRIVTFIAENYTPREAGHTIVLHALPRLQTSCPSVFDVMDH